MNIIKFIIFDYISCYINVLLFSWKNIIFTQDANEKKKAEQASESWWSKIQNKLQEILNRIMSSSFGVKLAEFCNRVAETLQRLKSSLLGGPAKMYLTTTTCY